MAGFEPADRLQPQENENIHKPVREKQHSFSWAVAVLFVIVVLLCANNYYLIDSINNLKNSLNNAYVLLDEEKLKKQKLADSDSLLAEQMEKLAEENRKLKESYEKASRGSDDLNKTLDELKRQNSALNKQNKSLVDDNVALQNSLKMAASIGIKPQNYDLFEGLQPRTALQRGKYLGKFLGTAYTPSKEECGNDRGITKSGRAIIPGISVAVDGSYWPFGTVFYIKGLGYTVAMDSGSAIKGKYRFDFSVLSRDFAMLLGSRKWEVYLVRLGNGKVGNIKL
jgi:3D (Asp-Asp-Asp) domain-containing protein